MRGCLAQQLAEAEVLMAMLPGPGECNGGVPRHCRHCRHCRHYRRAAAIAARRATGLHRLPRRDRGTPGACVGVWHI